MQHDYEITVADANTGVTMRAAINAALQALATMNEGPDEPTVTYPSMPWPDTTNNLLKIRNPANNAWVTIGKLDEIYLGLAALAAENEFTATQKLEGDALLLRFKDTGASGAEWGIRSDGGNFEIALNTGTEGSPTWTVQARIDVNSLRVGNGTASDINIVANNDAVNKPAIRYQASGSKWQYSNDGSTFSDIGMATSIRIPVRQTVLSSAIDGNGLPNYISAGTGLAVDIAATEIPVRIAFSAGHGENGAFDYVGTIESDTSILSLTANATNHLYAERNSGTGEITLGKTLYAPLYGVSPAGGVHIDTDGGVIYRIKKSTTEFQAAQSITPNLTGIVASLSLGLSKSGSPSGDLTVEIQTDNSNAPSGTAITNGVSNTVASSGLSGTKADVPFTFANAPILVSAVKYWIVLKSTASIDALNYVNWFANSSSNYSGGVGAAQNSSGTWTPDVYDNEMELVQNAVFFFSIPEMTMYDYSSGSAVAKQMVFLGEAVTDGSSVTGVVNYALRGEYNSGVFSVAVNTIYNKAANIGVNPEQVEVRALYRTNSSYAWMNYGEGMQSYGTTTKGGIVGPVSRNSIRLLTTNNSQGSTKYVSPEGYYESQGTTGADATGEVIMFAKRRF